MSAGLEGSVLQARVETPVTTRGAVLLGTWTLRGLFRVLRALPEGGALAVSRLVSRVLARPFAASRHRAQAVLFPDLSSGDRQAMDARHVEYLARVRVHGARLPVETRESLGTRIRLEGEQHLAEARQEGRGVLVVSGHAGSWLHVAALLATRGHPMLFFTNPALHALRSYLGAVAERHGFAITDVGDGASEAVRGHFARGGVAHVTIDATIFPERSLWLRFGPAELLIDPGPAVLALRHRVPVVWAETYHDESGRSVVRLDPPSHVGRGTDLARPADLMQRWLDRLWSGVAARPEQWWPLPYVHTRPGVASTSVDAAALVGRGSAQ